jgi:SagB-type dehydrogenase family enzyme
MKAKSELAHTVVQALAARTGEHQVLPAAALVFAADYRRMAWKYESISYATILRNVGCVYQTVSIAASVLGVGVCAIGGGWGALASGGLGAVLNDRAIVGAMVLGVPDVR